MELPDEYGLSSDSLRGSTQMIRTDIVGINDDNRRDPYTGNKLSRLPLSLNERRALHAVGQFVDEDGQQIDGVTGNPKDMHPDVLAYPLPVSANTYPSASATVQLFAPPIGAPTPAVAANQPIPTAVEEESLTAEEWALRDKEPETPKRMSRAEWQATQIDTPTSPLTKPRESLDFPPPIGASSDVG
jgi:hypothetical protein